MDKLAKQQQSSRQNRFSPNPAKAEDIPAEQNKSSQVSSAEVQTRTNNNQQPSGNPSQNIPTEM